MALSSSAVYLAVLFLITYFLAYRSIALPYSESISEQIGFIFPFLEFWSALVVLLIAYISVNYYAINENGRKHVRSGLWIVALLVALILISFFGPYGPLESPLITFPEDNLVAIAIGIIFYLWSVRVSFFTEDLEAVLSEYRESAKKPN
ncbi:MAG: hypothetical protein ACP5GH_02240 [Nitrososphaeria archaeon]